jgi:hypothetical protein
MQPKTGNEAIHDMFNLSRMERDFEAFHRNNPEVYNTLVRLARQAKALGHQRVGIKMLWEVMRWEVYIATANQIGGNSEYKLNNNYTSRYARRIMEQESDLDGFFELRTLK